MSVGMTNQADRHPLLKQSLYLFSLPHELLESLHPRAAHITVPINSETIQDNKEKEPEEETTSLGCSTCKILTFQSVANQRLHFRSDWHRYNLKLRRTGHGNNVVTEEQFDNLAENLEGSLSGSDSSDNLDSSEEDLAVSRISKMDINEDATPTLSQAKSPFVWFTSSSIPDTQFGLYKVAFSTLLPDLKASATTDPQKYLDTLKSNQLAPISTSKLTPSPASYRQLEPDEKTWAIFMIGGGHFAGMIISQVPKVVKVSGKLEREWIVLEHKTVHRYTTRRKQGGSQGLNDQAKGKAKSAGAQIRRYNEAALQDDVRNTLASWKERLKTVSAIFMRSSKANSQIFYNYEEAAFGRHDSRVHTIPFPTRRPTLAECRRVFEELTRIRLSYFTEDALKAMDDAFAAEQLKRQRRIQQATKSAANSQIQKKLSTAASAPASPKLSDSEKLERRQWQRVIDMAQKGRLDALIAFVEKRSEESGKEDALQKWTRELPGWSAEAIVSPTLLHVASAAGQAGIVRWLLLDCRSDPTTTSATMPRTAYEVAENRSTRNIFRRCMADHPEWYDWQTGAQVPSALSEEQEAEQRGKDRERKSRLKERAREREEDQRKAETLRRAESEEASRLQAIQDQKKREAKPNVPQKLGGVAAHIARAKANDSMAGLSEEAKMRVERERRARAAEARFGRQTS